ncbi:MAG TPA: alkaline phosphatase family protein [Polyangia bacterium]|nr:alkaline phosphatase family protein [Polyangia bacterium]
MGLSYGRVAWAGIAGSVLLAGWLGCGEAGPGHAAPRPADANPSSTDAAAPGPAAVGQVIVVAMENEDIGEIYGDDTDAPYLNLTLVPGYAHATEFVDELGQSVPSEPHYVWLEAGTNAFADHTFTTDDAPSAHNSTASTAHLTAQMAAAGLDWTAYQEGLDAATGSCPVAGAGFYAPKHDPFVFFQDLAGSPPAKTAAACAAHMKDLSALPADLAAGALARYVFITPDLCHDMHGASACPDHDLVKSGDDWLALNLPPLIAYADAHAGVVFLVWDEGDPSGHLPFLALGAVVKPGYAGAQRYTHSSVLKTTEEILGLPPLPTVAAAPDLGDLFRPGALPAAMPPR